MQIIGNLFNIVLYVTVIGSMFTIFSLLAIRICRFTLPLWFNICGIFTYIVPLIAPGLNIVSPEEQLWINEYYIACVVWIFGIVLFLIYKILKLLLTHCAFSNYLNCEDNRINIIYNCCVLHYNLKKRPKIYSGSLEDPICVVGALNPKIILNESIIKQLSDTDLKIVFSHELIHIKRRHMGLDYLFDCVCILNWFNPFVWIAKNEFMIQCEMDCDRTVLINLNKEVTAANYASTMLRLLEISIIQTKKTNHKMGALSFLLTKKRIESIINKQTKLQKVLQGTVLTILLILVILYSVTASKVYFYPYPAYSTEPEYSNIN